MKTYIINAPILTNYGLWLFDGPISVSDARSIIAEGFISAVGHQASAEILTKLLNVRIPVNRIEVTMEPSDRALILRLKQRLPEGKVLNEEELSSMPFELGLLTHIK